MILFLMVKKWRWFETEFQEIFDEKTPILRMTKNIKRLSYLP
jgi:hypothetical protein